MHTRPRLSSNWRQDIRISMLNTKLLISIFAWRKSGHNVLIVVGASCLFGFLSFEAHIPKHAWVRKTTNAIHCIILKFGLRPKINFFKNQLRRRQPITNYLHWTWFRWRHRIRCLSFSVSPRQFNTMISGQVANEYTADVCVMPVSLETKFMRLHFSLNALGNRALRTHWADAEN